MSEKVRENAGAAGFAVLDREFAVAGGAELEEEVGLLSLGAGAAWGADAVAFGERLVRAEADRPRVADEIAKLENELRIVRSKIPRETVEQNLAATLAALRGADYHLPAPEAVAAGSVTATSEVKAAFAALIVFRLPGAKEALADFIKPQLHAAPSAKEHTKAISVLQGRLDRLHAEDREAELAELRADLERRTALIEAEQNAAVNA
jgi:hypothetical protein